MPVNWFWLGRADYKRVLADQLAARERVWAGGDGVVLLCEHPPVFTLGRSATTANIIDAGDIPIERIERGGEVTYHGPGQLMIYPIVRITSVITYLERVATAIAEGCAELGVAGAHWRRDPAGVWLEARGDGGRVEAGAGAGAADIARAPRTGDEARGDGGRVEAGDVAKLAACGIHVARGVPVHGFALNVDTPAEMWRRIRPCGLDVPQVSLASVVPSIDVPRAAIAVGPRVAAALSMR